jgi:predicted HAD superfamily Cof-like phosphohydrolase
MSKATVTFEDNGDEVAVHVDFGPGGGQEGSGAHQMAMSAVTNLQREHLNNYERTARWLKACGKEPNPENFSVQVGCMAEEFRETLETLSLHKPGSSPESSGWREVMERIVADMDAIGKALKSGELVAYVEPHKRVAMLDGLCDVEVTANGVAYMAGFDKPSADQAVLASNEAKLVDGKPVFVEGTTKIGKPSNWRAPDLRGFV